MGLEQTASTAASTAPAVATAADAAPAGAPAPAAGLVAGAASAAQPAPGAAATAAGTAAAPSFSRRFARWIGQGESTVASVGIIAAAILLSTMAASSWWTERTQRQQLARWRGEHVRSLVNTLSVSLESMLAYNELTQARRLLAEVARSDDLTLCRVTLPDGRVVADAVPSKINVQQLPETWPRRAAVLQEFSADNGEVRATQPLMIPGRGPAALELAAPLVHAPGARWETQAGVGAIGGGRLVCLRAFCRRLRARMRAIGAVRDARLALGRGERARAVLSVNPQLGAEAGPWNALLAEVEQLTRQLQVEQAKEVLASRRSARGDLDAAFDALPQGLALGDEQRRLRYVNGAAAVF